MEKGKDLSLQNNRCPICGGVGTPVKNITVKHIVLGELTEMIGDGGFNLCMNEDCGITYYNSNANIKFNRKQLRVPIWFKKDANPKFACYCSEVTEAQVIDAVVNDGARSVEDVIRLTGAMNHSECQKKNPLGTCCHQIIQEAIDKGLDMILKRQ